MNFFGINGDLSSLDLAEGMKMSDTFGCPDPGSVNINDPKWTS